MNKKKIENVFEKKKKIAAFAYLMIVIFF